MASTNKTSRISRFRLVTESGELLVDGGSLRGRLESGGLGLLRRNLALVERGSLDLSLLLEAVDDVTVRPSDLVRETLFIQATRQRVQNVCSLEIRRE